MVVKDRFRRRLRVAAAAAAWLGVGLLFAGMNGNRRGWELVQGTVQFLSYFTILSNLFGAVALSVTGLRPESRAGRWLAQPRVWSGIGLYLFITASVYFMLLRGLWRPVGAMAVGNVLSHYLVPALYLADWLLFQLHGQLQWKDALLWLAFPMLYAAYSLVRGAMIESYPYPFIDVAALGYPQVLLNSLILCVVFALFGLGLVGLDRRLAHQPGP